MPKVKIKNKSGAKKRFKVTGTGKVMAQGRGKRHNLRKRPQKMKRQARGMKTLSDPNIVTVRKHWLRIL